MNTLWLKIASAVIGILILIVLVSTFMPGGDKESTPPEEEQSTFYDQVERDRENLLVTEEIPEDTEIESLPAVEPTETINTETPTTEIARPVEPVRRPTEMTIYIKQLNEIEESLAEQEISFEVANFSIGRLPVTSYKPAVDSARRILDRWPESIYAFKAKLMLAKIPIRYRDQYKITSDELSTNMFFQSRAGTVPVTVTIEDQ